MQYAETMAESRARANVRVTVVMPDFMLHRAVHASVSCHEFSVSCYRLIPPPPPPPIFSPLSGVHPCCLRLSRSTFRASISQPLHVQLVRTNVRRRKKKKEIECFIAVACAHTV